MRMLYSTRSVATQWFLQWCCLPRALAGKGVRASAKVTEGGSLAFKCMWKTELRKFHQMSGQFEGALQLSWLPVSGLW